MAENTNIQNQSVTDEATSYRIHSLFLKDESGSDSADGVQGINIPLATDIDNVFLEYPYKTTTTDASTTDTVTTLKSLRDLLFGTYTYTYDENNNPKYQYGYLMPFDVNNTSFIQYLIDTQKDWMDNFFGIYSPDEDKISNNEDGSPLGYYFNLQDVQSYCLIPALGEDGVSTEYRQVTPKEAREIHDKITNRSLAQLLLTAENYWALLPEETYNSPTGTLSIVNKQEIRDLFNWNDSATEED